MNSPQLHTRLLRHAPMFRGLDEADLQAIADHTTTHTYPRNTILMREGEPPDAMYVVVEGRVKVYVSDPEGKELVLDSLRPGDFFGELALIDGSPRSATVITTAETTISKILKTDFDRCLVASPRIAINLLRTLSKRIRILNDNVKDLALLDVYGRVARTILRLAHERNGVMVTDPITQQELANMVGASREMVSRVIKTLKSEGYISISGKQITVLSTVTVSDQQRE